MFRSKSVCVCVCVWTILKYTSAKFYPSAYNAGAKISRSSVLSPSYTPADTYHRKGWSVQPKWRVNSFRCNCNPFVFTRTHIYTYTHYISGTRLFSYYPPYSIYAYTAGTVEKYFKSSVQAIKKITSVRKKSTFPESSAHKVRAQRKESIKKCIFLWKKKSFLSIL